MKIAVVVFCGVDLCGGFYKKFINTQLCLLKSIVHWLWKSMNVEMNDFPTTHDWFGENEKQ